ncbi:glutamate receptor-like [Tachypleus tridentatus]|uniref:glutamate receptor-like n=1 Tax=Tachypleus tridentatus TaxID=6853 RepID=UPI003FCFC41A
MDLQTQKGFDSCTSLKDKIFNVIIPDEWIPWVSVHGSTGEEGILNKMFKEITEKLGIRFNITNFSQFNDSSDISTSWTPVLKRLLAEEFDFAMGPFVQTTERLRYVDFTRPIYIDDFGILAGCSMKETKTFLAQFEWKVWLVLILSVLLVSGVSWLFTEKSGHYTHEKSNKKCFMNQTWDFCTLLLNQGMSRVWCCSSWRVLFGFYAIATVFILCFVNGNIIGSVINQPTVTLHEVANNKSIKLIIPRSSVVKNVIEDDKKNHIRHLQKKLFSDTFIDAGAIMSDKVLDKVETGTHALIALSSDISIILKSRYEKKMRCSFRMSEIHIGPIIYGIPVNKKLLPCLKDFIDKSVQRFVRIGHLKKEIEQGNYYHQLCLCKPSKTKKALNLKNLDQVFYLFCGGMVLSTLILFVECLWKMKGE